MLKSNCQNFIVDISSVSVVPQYENMYSDFKKIIDKNQINTFIFSFKFLNSSKAVVEKQIEASLDKETAFQNWLTFKRKSRKIICRHNGRKLYEPRFNKQIKKDFWLVHNFLKNRQINFNISVLKEFIYGFNLARIEGVGKRSSEAGKAQVQTIRESLQECTRKLRLKKTSGSATLKKKSAYKTLYPF